MAASMNYSSPGKTSNFQALYNSKRSPSPWKDKFRKRCFDNLKRNREKLVNKFRKIKDNEDCTTISAIMAEEWEHLKDEDNYLPDIHMHGSRFQIDAEGSDEVGSYLSIFDEIQEELKQEEQLMIEEYEQGLEFDEKSLCESIQNLDTDEVLCPLCQKNPLMCNKNVIFCKCGMRINTEQDGFRLKYVKDRIKEGLSEHSSQCEAEVSFGLIDAVTMSNVIMTCSICDFMSIVI